MVILKTTREAVSLRNKTRTTLFASKIYILIGIEQTRQGKSCAKIIGPGKLDNYTNKSKITNSGHDFEIYVTHYHKSVNIRPQNTRTKTAQLHDIYNILTRFNS